MHLQLIYCLGLVRGSAAPRSRLHLINVDLANREVLGLRWQMRSTLTTLLFETAIFNLRSAGTPASGCAKTRADTEALGLSKCN